MYTKNAVNKTKQNKVITKKVVMTLVSKNSDTIQSFGGYFFRAFYASTCNLKLSLVIYVQDYKIAP